MHKYQVGDEVKAKIVGVQHYGAFAQIGKDLVGLIHISEISEQFVRNVADYFAIGDEVEVMIIELDETTQRAKLSIKRLAKNGKRYRSIIPYHRKPYVCLKMENFADVSDYMQANLEKMMKEVESMLITLETKYCDIKIDEAKYQDRISDIHFKMNNKETLGNDFLGWLNYPNEFNEKEVAGLLKLAEDFSKNYQVLVVCGIGGSYLGARAAIEAINGLYPTNKGLEIVYLGNTFSPSYTSQVLEYLKDKNFAVNVISKSGTTTETSLAFRLLRQVLIEKYGPSETSKRIVATTDKEQGILHDLARQENYHLLVVPNDIGGRYSLLTPVGLFPMACAGIDVYELLLGAKKAWLDLQSELIAKNCAYQYALYRYELFKQGYQVEMLINYDPNLVMLAEWWKQLFAESEGKQGQGLLPVSACFSTDLHSLGQFIQAGSKILFETTLKADSYADDVSIPKEKNDTDQLNYLSNKSLSYINSQAYEGTIKAHFEVGKVPNLVLHYPKMDAFNFGYIVYFFMKACAMSAYLLDLNPFDQPGVEIYKKNMFQLLGKK